MQADSPFWKNGFVGWENVWQIDFFNAVLDKYHPFQSRVEKNTLDNEILTSLVYKAASKFMLRHMATALIIQECKKSWGKKRWQ